MSKSSGRHVLRGPGILGRCFRLIVPRGGGHGCHHSLEARLAERAQVEADGIITNARDDGHVGLPPDEPIRWQSLLRNFQCRAELKQPAEDIIKVLEQQRYLHPELGGPTVAREFEKLLRENQRRVDGG